LRLPTLPARRCCSHSTWQQPSASYTLRFLEHALKLRSSFLLGTPLPPVPARPPACLPACRFLPLLRRQMVPYQLHLYAERVECGLQRVAQLLLQ